MPSQSILQRSGSMLLTWTLAVCWASSLFTEVFGKYTFVPFITSSFMFDWTPVNQTPPVPTTAQCETIHIAWSRQSATGPNPTAPYSLQVFTSTFIVPFSIDAGIGPEFDWPVPFVPGTQYQICMWDAFGFSGGCQATYTVYQAPNTTIDNPPTCRNLTYPHEDQVLSVEATVTSPPGPMSQFGWIDQCTDISLKPTNGTPPYTMTIAPSLHPPFNITSQTMDTITWTNTLTWGMPFFVSLVDSSGMIWQNGPLHSGGPGPSTDCLIGGPLPSNGKIQPWVAGVSSVLTLIVGLLAGLFGAVYVSRRVRKQSALRPEQFLDRKSTSTSIHSELPALPHGALGQPSLPTPPGVPTSSGAQNALHNRLLGRNPSRQFEPFALPADPEGGAASSSVIDIVSPATNQSNHELSRSPSDATSTLISRSPSDVSNTSADVRSATSHVYVVHHDGGRPPVTVYTADGTEVVELPPRYNETASPPPPPEPAAASSSAPPAQTQRSDLPKLPVSPGQLSVSNP